MEKLWSQSSLFKYDGHSVDQEMKLTLENEAELDRERSLNQLNFLSHVGIATLVLILKLLIILLVS